MKKILCMTACLAFVASAAFAQSAASKKVPLSIYVPEQADGLSESVNSTLATKLRQIVMNNGMAATDDVTQFYITCTVDVADKQVVAGAPVKIAQKLDVTFQIVDGFGQKVFGLATVSARGVGDNENKSYIEALRQVSPRSPQLKGLIENTNARIIAYYDEQADNIIAKARTLGLAKQYGEAFFQLSLIPEACEAYPQVIEVAGELYQKYIDDEATANLAKARSIWVAGQDTEAAYAAAAYLGMITPEATCYPQAEKLMEEIRARVSDNVDWERAMTEKIIDGWREIGVAYGNNQQPVTYNVIN